MGPKSDDITPVCEPPRRAQKKTDRPNPTYFTASSRKSCKPQIYNEKVLTTRGLKVSGEPLWDQIAAGSRCVLWASDATALPSGCELPHCHHALSLGRI
jgi:hypothetical protein